MATLANIITPVSVMVGQNINYTVPEGRVARVSVCATVSSSTSVVNGSTSTSIVVFTSNASANSISQQITLKAGDIITSSRSTGAGTTNQAIGVQTYLRSAVASVSILINAVAAFLVQCNSQAYILLNVNPTTGGQTLLNSTGSADISFVAEEYYA